MPLMMRMVALAMVPGLVAHALLYNLAFIGHALVAIGVAFAAEALCLRCRGLPWRVPLADGGVLVTALLLAVCMGASRSWLVTVVATVIAVVVGKHLFGGLGRNVFNPAMVGYVFALLCFPDRLGPLAAGAVDSVSAATPLAYLKTEMAAMSMLDELTQGEGFATPRPDLWRVAAGAWFIGGLFLIWRRVIDWRVPLAALATLSVFSLVAHWHDPQSYLSPLWHITLGGAVLGAFFIATDPVSSAVTPGGRWLYGAGIGFLIWAIRVFGSFPDGVAGAVLVMNAAAPALDRLFLQRR